MSEEHRDHMEELPVAKNEIIWATESCEVVSDIIQSVKEMSTGRYWYKHVTE